MFSGQTLYYSGNATLDAIAAGSGAATLLQSAEWFALLGLALLFTALRTWARVTISTARGLGWDDCIAWVALMFNAIHVTTTYFLTVPYAGIANDSISAARRAALGADPDSLEFVMRVVGSKLQLLSWVSYASALWSLKGALLVFFVNRLSLDLQGQRGQILCGTLLIPGTWLMLVLVTLFSCHPLKQMWQIYPDPGEVCHASDSPVLVWSYWACNILTDLYLLSIPVPVLMRASLTPKQRMGLLGLFGCTILITIMGIVRLILIEADSSTNADGVWALREVFIATITTSLAPTMPIFRRVWRHLFGDIRRVRGGENNNNNNNSMTRQGKVVPLSKSLRRGAPRHWRLGRLSIPVSLSGGGGGGGANPPGMVVVMGRRGEDDCGGADDRATTGSEGEKGLGLGLGLGLVGSHDEETGRRSCREVTPEM